MTLRDTALAAHKAALATAEVGILPAGVPAAMASEVATVTGETVVAGDIIDARGYGGTLWFAVALVDDVVIAAVHDTAGPSTDVYLARWVKALEQWDIYGTAVTDHAGLGEMIAAREGLDLLAVERSYGLER